MSDTPLIPARPAPRHPGGPAARVRAWARRHLFDGWASTLATLTLLAAAAWALPPLFDQALLHAVWRADLDACQAARGSGACWGVITEKHRLIVFGRYPLEEQWRPALATAGLFVLLVASGVRRCWHRGLVLAWGLGLAGFFVLMGGGLAGLAPVPTDRWGGLPLTLMLSTLSIALAFPLAVLVALGRRSRMPAIRTLCGLYVELVRGVPLISVLFMASFLFPLFLPAGTSPDVLLRVLAGISLFAAAYLAETVRAGLQAIPRGQAEAAASVGLGWWATQRLVVLPQALATVVPGLLNSFISIFKDSSLITIVSLYELTGSLGLALNGDPVWRPFLIEGYVFITLIYFVICAAMSRYSLWVEQQLARSQVR
ncbi:amino acid ABC transporter membrane protein 2 (PAAT family) [Sphaerotilus hippei]|uniref:Amino acid ABC transporter membrane protein 2 (PAAT family) n=1 Tax=Sphaerotilus hippei TaxID=744406 RepID=A0A318HH46_9BURK|nr:amino acid ABC transporter permease [Sphaerotilus hippei]PXW99383.1 amino acid ABC transporter membrane protein 2 (PAAT family) [Sphaerotilus hippei]